MVRRFLAPGVTTIGRQDHPPEEFRDLESGEEFVADEHFDDHGWHEDTGEVDLAYVWRRMAGSRMREEPRE